MGYLWMLIDTQIGNITFPIIRMRVVITAWDLQYYLIILDPNFRKKTNPSLDLIARQTS